MRHILQCLSACDPRNLLSIELQLHPRSHGLPDHEAIGSPPLDEVPLRAHLDARAPEHLRGGQLRPRVAAQTLEAQEDHQGLCGQRVLPPHEVLAAFRLDKLSDRQIAWRFGIPFRPKSARALV